MKELTRQGRKKMKELETLRRVLGFERNDKNYLNVDNDSSIIQNRLCDVSIKFLKDTNQLYLVKAIEKITQNDHMLKAIKIMIDNRYKSEDWYYSRGYDIHDFDIRKNY